MSILGVVVVLLRAVDGSLGGVVQASVHGAVQTLVVHAHCVVRRRWCLAGEQYSCYIWGEDSTFQSQITK